MALSTTVTEVTSADTRYAGCVCAAHMRSSTKGTGGWDRHRIVWDFTAYPDGYEYTATDPRPGAQLGDTVNCRDGDFEGFNFAFYAYLPGTYTVRCTITDTAGNTSSDTQDFVVGSTQSTVTLAADGSGDYTTLAALVTGESLGSTGNLGLKVVVKSGTYSESDKVTILASGVWFEWDEVGSQPIFTSATEEVLRFTRSNNTLDGIAFQSSATGPGGTSSIIDWFLGRLGLVNCDFGKWRTNVTAIGRYGAGGAAGVLLLNCTGDSCDSDNGYTIGEFSATPGETAVFVGCNVVATIDGTRVFYAQDTDGTTCVACRFRHQDDDQCVRWRALDFCSMHRCWITNGITSGAETGSDLSAFQVTRSYVDVDFAAGSQAPATMGDFESGVAVGCGYHSCVIAAGVYGRSFTSSINSSSECGFVGCTVVSPTDGDTSRNLSFTVDVFAFFSLASGSYGHDTEACLFVHNGVDNPDGVNFFILDANFSGAITDSIFPVAADLTVRGGTSFYEGHPDGDTDLVATANGYTGVSGLTEENVALDSDFVPSTTRTVSAPSSAHLDYYGNAVSGSVLPGAVQSLPATDQFLALSAGGSFLVLGT